MPYVIIAVVAAVLLFFAYAHFEESKQAYFEAYAKNSKAFYAASDRLLAKEHISNELLDILETMTLSMDNKKMAELLYRTVRRKEPAADVSCATAPVYFSEKADLAERKEIEDLFHQAFRFWLLAVLNKSPLYGRKMLAVLNVPEKKIVREITQGRADHNAVQAG